MRRVSRLMLLLMLLVVTACATTPRARWFQAAKSLEGTERALLIAWGGHYARDDRAPPIHGHGGVLTREQFMATEGPILAAKAALDEAWKFLPDGGTNFDHLIRVAALNQSRIQRVLQQMSEQPSNVWLVGDQPQ